MGWVWGRGGGQNSAVHGNCAPQTCGTQEWWATTVRCKLAVHIVCQNSALQLCTAYLWRTLCASTVRGNCALQTCGAHCVPEQCARKEICIRKTRLQQTCRNYMPQTCRKLAAYMYQRPYILVRCTKGYSR